MSNDQQDKNIPPQGGGQEELKPGEFRYGYSTDGTFSMDLGNGDGPVALDKVSDSRIEFLPAPTITEEVQRELEEARSLREKYAELEPLAHIKDREDFREWLKERVEYGDLPDPNPPPKPGPDDIMGTQARRQEAIFPEVVEAMREYAATLDERDQELLMNNHRVFNETYDKFKAARGNRPPIVPRTTGAPLNWERSIAAKEVLKDQARIEPPGGIPSAPDPQKEARRKLDYWRSRMNDRSLTPTQRDEAEHQMAMYYSGGPDAKRGRR